MVAEGVDKAALNRMIVCAHQYHKPMMSSPR